jgi:hypothetical protein
MAIGPEEIRSAARLCRENGIAVMFDHLLGESGGNQREHRSN